MHPRLTKPIIVLFGVLLLSFPAYYIGRLTAWTMTPPHKSGPPADSDESGSLSNSLLPPSTTEEHVERTALRADDLSKDLGTAIDFAKEGHSFEEEVIPDPEAEMDDSGQDLESEEAADRTSVDSDVDTLSMSVDKGLDADDEHEEKPAPHTKQLFAATKEAGLKSAAAAEEGSEVDRETEETEKEVAVGFEEPEEIAKEQEDKVILAKLGGAANQDSVLKVGAEPREDTLEEAAASGGEDVPHEEGTAEIGAVVSEEGVLQAGEEVREDTPDEAMASGGEGVAEVAEKEQEDEVTLEELGAAASKDSPLRVGEDARASGGEGVAEVAEKQQEGEVTLEELGAAASEDSPLRVGEDARADDILEEAAVPSSGRDDAAEITEKEPRTSSGDMAEDHPEEQTEEQTADAEGQTARRRLQQSSHPSYRAEACLLYTSPSPRDAHES
eukprot:1177408-Prorocentrum_minimum.AAC.2